MDISNLRPGADNSTTERIPPRQRFASGIVQFDLRATAAQLEAECDEGQSGHRQIALYKHEKSTIALFRFKSGGTMKAHQAKGTVVIQVIEGKLTLDVAGMEHILETGGVLVLASGIQHDVRADRKTLMLLTVCLDG